VKEGLVVLEVEFEQQVLDEGGDNLRIEVDEFFDVFGIEACHLPEVIDASDLAKGLSLGVE
jgi:hypothetical protein